MADPVKLLAGQQITVTISAKDARGHAGDIDGVPVWVSSDDSIVDVRVADDGLSGIIGSFEEFGAFTVTVTADARDGEEVVPLIGVISGVVAQAEAVLFDVSVGEPVDRTEG